MWGGAVFHISSISVGVRSYAWAGIDSGLFTEPVSVLTNTHLPSRHAHARPWPVPSDRKQPDASSCF